MNTPPDRTNISRILLIRIGKIGDLIVCNFVFRKIRASFPDATIMLVTLPRNRELLRFNRTVDRLRYFRKGLDILPLILEVRSFRPDLVLDFNDNPSRTSTMLARFCPAPVKVGFAFAANRRYLTLPVECPSKEDTHITDRLRLIPQAIGLTFEPAEVVPSMDLDTRAAESVRRQMEGLRKKGGRIVAVNLSAGHPSRYWQTGKWCELLAEIGAVSPCQFVLLAARGEEDLAATVGARLPSARYLIPGTLNFHHFAAYIAQSDLLISPDTSAIHIADAFHIPVVGLYPAVEWNFRSWHPTSTGSVAVRPPSGDVGDIGVREVMEAYLRLEKHLS
jgi:ADP-heptose:LPS heptosyltransferase